MKFFFVIISPLLVQSALAYINNAPTQSQALAGNSTARALAFGKALAKMKTEMKDRYIVMLKKSISPPNRSLMPEVNILDQHLNQVRSFVMESDKMAKPLAINTTTSQEESDIKKLLKHIYQTDLFTGYAGKFNPAVIDQIRKMEEVELVEKDGIAFSTDILAQKNAPWGLSRISKRDPLDLEGTLTYLYDTNSAGEDVTAYIIDTGININHKEFEGRARWGKTFAQNSPDEDDNGHGTHVAGTVGSRAYGVAKKVNLVAVKVLNAQGSGAYSDIIAGIEWAAQDAKKRGSNKGSVANMSLGGGYSESINKAVAAAVGSGLAFAVAAGNEDQDACESSPASSRAVLTVGATNKGDNKAKFSNWGKCISLFAPGQDILSTWIGSPKSTNTISGTSMASPHICGLMAYFLGQSSGPMTPVEIYKAVLEASTGNAVKGLNDDTANLLAYNMITTI